MSAKALPPRPMLIQLALTWCLRTCLKGAFVGSALLFIISESIGSGLTVERVQRDFQARHKLVTGTYVEWPSCKTGGTPAPHFPKDGFYGDIIEDPEEGVRIVQDLVEKFYVGAIIYNHFVVAPSGYDSIHNAANIAEYTASPQTIRQRCGGLWTFGVRIAETIKPRRVWARSTSGMCS